MIEKQHIDDLLSKILSNDPLAEHEIIKLKEWADKSLENQETLINMRYAVWKTNTFYNENKISLFDKVLIKIKEKEKRRNIKIALFDFSTIASCLILAFILLKPFSYENEHLAINSLDISKEIILSDNTGKSTNLESLNNSNIFNEKVKINLDKKSIDFSDIQVSKESPKEFCQSVKEISIHIPLKKELNIVLPDGSKVWLNANSQIVFPEKFTKETRSIELIGEAYFDITHDESKPFIVQTQNITTQVYGTEFLLTAYSNDYENRVALINGSVGVKTKTGQKVLHPGEGVKYNIESQKLTEFAVDIEEVELLRKGLFLFKGIELEIIAKRLEQWYGVPINFSDEKLKHKKFFLKIDKHKEIETVLELIKNTKHIDYRLTNENITFIPLQEIAH